MSEKLTDKEARFCLEYLVDLNATQAAIRAGYSQSSAKQIAYELLQREPIELRITTLMQERALRTQVTADRVVRELARIGFSDLSEIASWDREGKLTLKASNEISSDASAAVVEIHSHTSRSKEGEFTTTRVKRADKSKALELLGRHLGLFEKDNEQSADRPLAISLTDEQLIKMAEAARGKKDV
jgi:phage terminase small subunit